MLTAMKELIYYLSLKYEIKLFGLEGAWAAWIPALPGCISDGKTPDEALAKLEEAKRNWIEACLEAGRPVPEP